MPLRDTTMERLCVQCLEPDFLSPKLYQHRHNLSVPQFIRVCGEDSESTYAMGR